MICESSQASFDYFVQSFVGYLMVLRHTHATFQLTKNYGVEISFRALSTSGLKNEGAKVKEDAGHVRIEIVHLDPQLSKDIPFSLTRCSLSRLFCKCEKFKCLCFFSSRHTHHTGNQSDRDACIRLHSHDKQFSVGKTSKPLPTDRKSGILQAAI